MIKKILKKNIQQKSFEKINKQAKMNKLAKNKQVFMHAGISWVNYYYKFTTKLAKSNNACFEYIILL